MAKKLEISLFELIISISNTVDMICPTLVNHHKQVAYIAYSIAEEMNLPSEKKIDILLAGALHDIGALSLQERLKALTFETEDPKHAEVGSCLLKLFPPFKNIAEFIEFHHLPWHDGRGQEFNGKKVPIESHILHLADRTAVLIDKNQEILIQVDDIIKKIKDQSGKIFAPQLVEVFEYLASKEFFWLETVLNSSISKLKGKVDFGRIKLDINDLGSLAKLFAKIIDFRSPFTAYHSSGVAASAEIIAKLLKFSEQDCRLIKIAGFFHDLGKLAIPKEILEKPGRLTRKEYNIMKSHVYYTYYTLKDIKELETISEWSSFHHEKLDGSGYPFHITEQKLSLGARIMAVADIFTALSENRPYRKGLERREVLKIIQDMSGRALDEDIVQLLKKNYDEINYYRISAQKETENVYHKFLCELKQQA